MSARIVRAAASEAVVAALIAATAAVLTQRSSARAAVRNQSVASRTDIEREAAFVEAFRYLRNRIAAFTSLPLQGFDRLSLGTRLRDIGLTAGATSGQEKAS